MSGGLTWFGIFVLAALTLFTTLNLALRVPSRARLASQFDRLRPRSSLEQFVTNRPQYMLATAFLRSTFTLALLIDLIFLGTFSHVPSFLIVLVLATVFGVAIPYAWAKYSGEWLIVRCLPMLAAIRYLLFPIILVMEMFDPFVRRLAGVPVRDAKSFADELEQEILRMVTEGELHGAVDEKEKEMIESVIELGDMTVAEIMTPRTDIVALPKDADLESILNLIRTKGHSRIPVYDQTIDTILGVLYAKDLLLRAEDAPFSLTANMRKPFFIPESKPVDQLLREFQEKKLHMAIVLDEYGGTAGLVTIEDVLEEVVGDITDEFDPSAPVELRRIDDSTVEVDARMRLDELNDQLNIELPEDEAYETIGGFVFSTMGKIPTVGEQCVHDNVGIQVIAAEPRRITRLRVHVSPRSENVKAEPL